MPVELSSPSGKRCLRLTGDLGADPVAAGGRGHDVSVAQLRWARIQVPAAVDAAIGIGIDSDLVPERAHPSAHRRENFAIERLPEPVARGRHAELGGQQRPGNVNRRMDDQIGRTRVRELAKRRELRRGVNGPEHGAGNAILSPGGGALTSPSSLA
jgi:hypothetical protein